MAKIKWEPASPGIGWNRVKSLRKKMGLNQATVAVGAGISIATLYNIEHGYEQTTTLDTKKRLAKYFKCDVQDLFPAQMIGNETKEEYDRKIVRRTPSHRFEMLKDFLPDLEFSDEVATAQILESMNIDELGELFRSGLTKEEALDHLQRAAKKNNLSMPETK